MRVGIPRVVIGGAGSGVGKTSIALGLTRLLVRRGLRVQTFKVGPDFLDPTYLRMASGRPCFNMDGWMMGSDYCLRLFARASRDADIAVIEGVMGLFDGAGGQSLEGSTAEIARLLEAPVLLVTSARGVGRTMAASVRGFVGFESGVDIAGVIANFAGSDNHRNWLGSAMRAAALPPLIGAVPAGSLGELPSRHLGLVAADKADVGQATLDELADACQRHMDVEKVIEIARGGGPLDVDEEHERAAPARDEPVGLAVAQDEAFHFYYPDNLAALEAAGAKLLPFSPLHDSCLPEGTDALYLGGGYPEEHAAALSANEPMRAAVKQFCRSGRCVYGECGGLMYLGRSIETLDGSAFAMARALDIDSRMLPRRSVLGYVEVQTELPTVWGPPPARLRGHEFHYSQLVRDDSGGLAQRPYRLSRRTGDAGCEGFLSGGLLAGYVHLHWACRRGAAESFVEYCRSRR